MKQNELVFNINEARQHIRRLKKQAEIMDIQMKAPISNKDQSFTLNQYVSNALYSLSKNDNQISSKVQQYVSDNLQQTSNKLPSIYQKQKKSQLFYLQGYKRQRKCQKKGSQRSKIASSTRIDQSLNLSIQNRRIKMHSFQQKHKPLQISSQSNLGSLLQHDYKPQSLIFQKQLSSHSTIRKRKEQKVRFQKGNDKQVMEYQNVVDSFSNHFFMIVKGKLASQSPEYLSYQRIYKSIFHKIQSQIDHLQNLLQLYQVAFARFDGKKLAYLCLKDNIKKSQLIDCLVQGKQEILSKIPQTKYKGKQGKIRAANKIISYWRMISVRTKYKILKKNTIILQNFFRRRNLMLDLQRKIIKRNQKILSNFQDRQNGFQKNYKTIKTKKRIQIHLNSIQVDEQKRLTIQNFSTRENLQLSRIFRLRDPNLILILITPSQVSHQLISYYHKILSLCQIANAKDRLIFISPENNKFPQYFSSSKLLYYCSKTLNQLKDITRGMETILIGGQPCNQMVRICQILGAALFGAQPTKARQFMLKSRNKRFLTNLGIQTLPGSMEMYDYGEFLNTFSVLILKNPQISTWVLKIDDQFSGRGIAYIQIGKSKIVTSLLKKIQQQTNSQFFATDIATDSSNQQITVKIRDYLKQKLASKLIIATPLLYRNYEQFMGRFIKKGGIIEAHPPCLRQNLTSPSISFCLQPDGEFKLICTYEKISSQPYRNIACSFPQKSLQYQQIMTLCRQLTESFKLRKLFGYFTVDLIHYKKNQHNKFWVIGIQPFLNDYSSSFYLFDALMEGKYVPDKNAYLTQTYSNEKQDDRVSLNTSVTDQSTNNIVGRQFLFVPHFLNKNFGKITIKQFFKQARIQGFNFDIAQKSGVCVLLFDQLTSGQMGILTVSESKEQSIEKLKKILQFIARITCVKNLAYGKSDLQPATDSIFLTDIMSKFLTLERKQKRKDARQKAISQYKNNQNLQLII